MTRSRNKRLLAAAITALLAYAAAAGLSAGQASAAVWDDVAWMYQPSEVVDVHLTLDDTQKAVINSDAEDRPWATGVGFWMTGSGGRTFGSEATPWRIEAKLKGHSTFRFLDGKAAFNLKFPSSSRPNGLKRMTLNNMVKDPTYLRETLSYDVLRAAGIPGPRTGYARLWVNGEYYGLYLNLEKYTDQTLAHWFASTGHLFEAVRTQDIVRSGDDLRTDFEVDEGDEEDWSDLEAFSAAVRTRNWTTIQSKLANPGQTIRLLAAEWYLGHWDGYSWSRRNYYLHSDANGLFTLLPTGTDQALRPPFGDSNYDLSYPLAAAADTWNQPGGASAIVDACFADAACSDQFINELDTVRQAADSLDLETRVPELTAALTPLIESDPRKEFTMRFIQRWQGDIIPWFTDHDSQVEQLLQTQPPPQYSLAISKIGDGSGNVGASPAGPLYDPGTVVTLTASADPGSSFVGWSGCDSIAAGNCVVTMTAARTVTAEFAGSKPVITATNPVSPANNNLPLVRGTLPGGATVSKVKIYPNSNCSGTPVANRDAAVFTGAGIPVAVADNTTTTLTAKGVLAGGGTTSCSSPFTYVEDSTGPAPGKPVITTTNPVSPADNNRPRVIGTVPAGPAVSKVKVYLNGTCSGTPAANRAVSLFTGAGIPVTVPDSTTTTLSVRGVLAGGGNTPCSDPFTYVES